MTPKWSSSVVEEPTLNSSLLAYICSEGSEVEISASLEPGSEMRSYLMAAFCKIGEQMINGFVPSPGRLPILPCSGEDHRALLRFQ